MTSQQMFEAITGPEHKIDLTLPRVKSPTAAERASWRADANQPEEKAA